MLSTATSGWSETSGSLRAMLISFRVNLSTTQVGYQIFFLQVWNWCWARWLLVGQKLLEPFKTMPISFSWSSFPTHVGYQFFCLQVWNWCWSRRLLPSQELLEPLRDMIISVEVPLQQMWVSFFLSSGMELMLSMATTGWSGTPGEQTGASTDTSDCRGQRSCLCFFLCVFIIPLAF